MTGSGLQTMCVCACVQVDYHPQIMTLTRQPADSVSKRCNLIVDTWANEASPQEGLSSPKALQRLFPIFSAEVAVKHTRVCNDNSSDTVE